jgi:hypothetical protein
MRRFPMSGSRKRFARNTKTGSKTNGRVGRRTWRSLPNAMDPIGDGGRVLR